MSGIVIIETKGPEYRVQFLNTPDKMYGEFNDNTGRFEPNSDFIHSEYDHNAVYFNRQASFDAAEDIAKLNAPLDDGIFLIDIWRHIEYPNL